MCKVILVTGGARAGKSAYAEKMADDEAGVLFIATATACDDEMEERIKFHRQNRPESWMTWERYHGLADIEKEFSIDSFGTIMLDCVVNLLMGILYDQAPDADNFNTEDFESVVQTTTLEIDSLCRFAVEHKKRLIIVTNEIGMGIVPETRYARYFRDALGHLNKHIARLSDEVILMVSGLPIALK